MSKAITSLAHAYQVHIQKGVLDKLAKEIKKTERKLKKLKKQYSKLWREMQ